MQCNANLTALHYTTIFCTPSNQLNNVRIVQCQSHSNAALQRANFSTAAPIAVSCVQDCFAVSYCNTVVLLAIASQCKSDCTALHYNIDGTCKIEQSLYSILHSMQFFLPHFWPGPHISNCTTAKNSIINLDKCNRQFEQIQIVIWTFGLSAISPSVLQYNA